MKKYLQCLLIISVPVITLFTSCSPGYHVGTGNKKNNLSHWQQDSKAKKEAKEQARRERKKTVDMVQK